MPGANFPQIESVFFLSFKSIITVRGGQKNWLNNENIAINGLFDSSIIWSVD